jgi:DDE superfamily endonuclease
MPTVPRRPAAQRERDRLQARRLRAGELFAAGVRQAEVARQLGVSAQAVSVWHARPQPGNYDTDTLIQVLAELRRFLGGEKATLLWDGLPAHRSRAMQAWLNTQPHWLVVERLPAYAPELNPVQGLWSWLKGTLLANLVCPPSTW